MRCKIFDHVFLRKRSKLLVVAHVLMGSIYRIPGGRPCLGSVPDTGERKIATDARRCRLAKEAEEDLERLHQPDNTTV